MKPNLLTEGRKAIFRQLQTITTANGYRTDAGTRVLSGWFADLITPETNGFPLVVVQKAPGREPIKGPGAINLPAGFHLIGAVDAGFDDYEDALEDLQEDLLRCVFTEENRLPPWLPRGITGVTYGVPQPFPPGNGLRCATVVIPIYLKTVIQKG